MKDISQLDKCFSRFVKNMTERLIKAQDHTTEEMHKDALQRVEIPLEARNIGQFIAYQDSISKKDAELNGNEITSSVYSDLLVGGDTKWADVPVGAFLEWGTGPLGEGSNNYDHGYPYTTDAPWDLHTEVQFSQIGTWGITARPHLYPAWVNSQYLFQLNVKEAVEEAWME